MEIYIIHFKLWFIHNKDYFAPSLALLSIVAIVSKAIKEVLKYAWRFSRNWNNRSWFGYRFYFVKVKEVTEKI